MTLHEEYNSTQDQLQWLMYLEQERQNLSASVEETLAEPSSLASDLLDDERLVSTSRKTTLIPPRLSLQSKMLPAVQPEREGQVLSGIEQGISTPKEPPIAPVTQEQNVFKRIAQRLTAVFGGVEPDEEGTTPSEQQKMLVAERPRMRQTALLPAVPSVPPYEMNERANSAKPKVIDAVPSARQPVMPMGTGEMSDTGKQRLAGKNVKVRLETVQLPVVAKEIEIPLQGEGASAARCSLSGVGTFENGQSDCTVKNKNITLTSVVQVMLTANPGPVALHYVSVQPQVGFTVHLTGPASKRTPFNYVILLCELF